MVVSLATPFRAILALPLETWQREFRNRQSPVTEDEVNDCWAACQGWAVLLDQAIGETSLKDADAIRDKNLLRMTEVNGSTFQKFSAFWKPFAIKWQQLYDPHYKAGVYYAGDAGTPKGYDLSLSGYKVIYQGGPACLSSRGQNCANGETYDPNKPMLGMSVASDPNAPSINRSISASMLRMERWFGSGPVTTPPPSSGTITFGRVPKPAWTDRQIPDANNWAWDNLGQRRVLGVTYHRMVGTLWGTDGWFRGGGGGSGLTDFGVDHNTGETLLWNDYLGRGRAGISPNRAGWASGPWQHGSAKGEAFVTKYGVDAINRDRTSIEVAGNYEDAISAAGRAKIVAITAYLADQAKIPWDRYPINPATGLDFPGQHHDYQNNKPCAGSVLIGLMPTIANEVKAVLKQHQVT